MYIPVLTSFSPMCCLQLPPLPPVALPVRRSQCAAQNRRRPGCLLCPSSLCIACQPLLCTQCVPLLVAHCTR